VKNRPGACWEDMAAELANQTTRAEAAEQELHEVRQELAEVTRQRDALRKQIDELAAAVINTRAAKKRGNRR